MNKKAKDDNDIFRALIETCNACGVDALVVIRPNRCRDKASSKQRLKVVRKLHADGWQARDIARVFPVTPRGMRKALGKKSRDKLSASSRTVARVRSSRGSTTLISPETYDYSTRRGLNKPWFLYKRTPRGIVCKRVALTKHPSYRSWRVILARCYDKAADGYAYYGARGIRVCSRWLDFRKFVRDMGERPNGEFAHWR